MPRVGKSSASLPVLRLSRPLRSAIYRGHPWIYRQALQTVPDLPTGTSVEIHDRDGFLAKGLFDRQSPLAVRVYTLDPAQSIDENFIALRLLSAYRCRLRTVCGLGKTTTGFRLCNGEGDGLPGVIVDVYGPVAVVVFDGDAAASLRPSVVRALQKHAEMFGISTIYERYQRRQGHGGKLLFGDPPVPPENDRGLHPFEFVFLEHGMRLLVDIEHGQKTGMFLDQRENRLLVRRCSNGLSVWNGFAYTGGFSVAAALGGATRVVSVDRAEAAIETAKRNVQLAGLPLDHHEFVVDDVFSVLQQTQARGERFDLVIVDPPSFAPTAQAVSSAISAYTKLHEQALDLVAPGGLFAAASCSSHIDEKMFLETICDAALFRRKTLRFLEVHGQPADHPTLPAFPEGRYLKFALCVVG